MGKNKIKKEIIDYCKKELRSKIDQFRVLIRKDENDLLSLSMGEDEIIRFHVQISQAPRDDNSADNIMHNYPGKTIYQVLIDAEVGEAEKGIKFNKTKVFAIIGLKTWIELPLKLWKQIVLDLRKSNLDLRKTKEKKK